MKTPTVEWTCSICGARKVSAELPTGWLSLWGDKYHVCDVCTMEIDSVRKPKDRPEPRPIYDS